MRQQESGVGFIKRCCPLLSAYNVRELVFEYDGSGDSGDFNSTTVSICPTHNSVEQTAAVMSNLPTDTVRNITRTRTMSWDDFVDERRKEKEPMITPEMCNTLLDNAFDLLPGGWEINDGSYGTIVVDVPTGEITVDHNERYTDVRSETFKY